jgi:toxin-antitoxin system PIN domain toxin
VALADASHTAHQRAHAWFRREPDRLWSTCPLTQAGFLRIVARKFGTSDGVRRALAGLEADCRSGNHEYWPVDVDLRDLTGAERGRLIGHNQVTDMQLLLLAYQHKGRLVTFDSGIAGLAKGTPYTSSVLTLEG